MCWKRNRVLLIILAVALVIIFVITRGMEPKVWMSILLSGITLAALYFLLASGLSLVFGLMDVLNFAQGAIFVMGAYVGLSTFMNPRLLLKHDALLSGGGSGGGLDGAVRYLPVAPGPHQPGAPDSVVGTADPGWRNHRPGPAELSDPGHQRLQRDRRRRHRAHSRSTGTTGDHVPAHGHPALPAAWCLA